MSVFSNSTLTRLAQDAENHLAQEQKLIVRRCAIATTIGYSEYQLPSDIISIRRVIWKGYKLEPWMGGRMINSTSTPLRPTSSQPYMYIYSDKGLGVLKLYPAPPEVLSNAYTEEQLWTPTGIQNCLIVEAFWLPDYTTNDEDKRIPSFMRRQIVKDYVLARAFAQEGKAQDIAASKYFMDKWKSNLEGIAGGIKSNITGWMLKNRTEFPANTRLVQARPVLPPMFGTVVD